MEQITEFYELKRRVLERYQSEYPSVALDWKTFSSKDIAQLIDSITRSTNERISEKWIYTHLKPAENSKLPRKNMLDILAMYCQFSSWDAFVYQLSTSNATTINLAPTSSKRTVKNLKIGTFILLICCLIGICNWLLMKESSVKHVPISIKDRYTKAIINDSSIRILIKENGKFIPIDSIKNTQQLKPTTELVVESPFYTEAKIVIDPIQQETNIELKPDDYAMILKAFITADINDWEKRKAQLTLILSDNLVAYIHLENELGIEYMNKTEFTQKLTIPTAKIKRWQIIALEQDEQRRIINIRIKQT